MNTYDNCPVTYTQDEGPFLDVLHRGLSGTVRLWMFSDSRFALGLHPGVDAVNRALFRLYGNSPETQLGTCGTFGGGPGNDSWTAWLLYGVNNTGATTRIASTRIPPGFEPKKFTDAQYGHVSNVNWSADRAKDTAIRNGTYFKRGTSVIFDIFAATNASSGEVAWRGETTTSSLAGFFHTDRESGTTSMGLESAVYAIKKQAVTVTLNGGAFPEIVLRGSDAVKYTDIIGVRCRSTVSSAGAVLNSASRSGANSADFLNEAPDCHEMIATVGNDMVIIDYGPNDGTQGISAATYKTNVQALISWIRLHFGATLPILLVAPTYRTGLTGPQQTQYDLYAGAIYELAQENAGTKFINMRLVLDRCGWNATYENTTGTTNRGEWASGTSYVANDLVTYGGRVFVSDASQSNKDPITGAFGNWHEVCRFTSFGDGVHWTAYGGEQYATTLLELTFGAPAISEVIAASIAAITATQAIAYSTYVGAGPLVIEPDESITVPFSARAAGIDVALDGTLGSRVVVTNAATGAVIAHTEAQGQATRTLVTFTPSGADGDEVLFRLSGTASGSAVWKEVAVEIRAAATGNTDDVLVDTNTIITRLGNGVIRLSSPVNSEDEEIEIVAGSAYKTADARALTWTVNDWAGPSMTGATVTFKVMTQTEYQRSEGALDLTVTGSAAQVGTTVTFTVELTSANTALLTECCPPLPRRNYKAHLRATQGGTIVFDRLDDLTVLKPVV